MGKERGLWIGMILSSVAYPFILVAGIAIGMLITYKYDYNISLQKTNDFIMDFYESGYLNLHKKEKKDADNKN